MNAVTGWGSQRAVCRSRLPPSSWRAWDLNSGCQDWWPRLSLYLYGALWIQRLRFYCHMWGHTYLAETCNQALTYIVRILDWLSCSWEVYIVNPVPQGERKRIYSRIWAGTKKVIGEKITTHRIWTPKSRISIEASWVFILERLGSWHKHTEYKWIVLLNGDSHMWTSLTAIYWRTLLGTCQSKIEMTTLGKNCFLIFSIENLFWEADQVNQILLCHF